MEKTKIPGKTTKRRGSFPSDRGSDQSDPGTRVLQKSSRAKNEELEVEGATNSHKTVESKQGLNLTEVGVKPGSSFAGVDAKTFAKARNIPEDQIWQMVLSGALQGRTFQGKLFILQGTEASPEIETLPELPQGSTNQVAIKPDGAAKQKAKADATIMVERASRSIAGASKSPNAPRPDSFPFVVSANASLQQGLQELPPIPIDSRDADVLSESFSGEQQEHFLEYVERKVSMKSTPAVAPSQVSRPGAMARPSESSEFSLLLDHMRVMQTEQQHLVALTRQAIEKITQQAEQIIQAKDELLAARQQDAERLAAESAALRQKLQEAKQEIEDLQMLNDVLQA